MTIYKAVAFFDQDKTGQMFEIDVIEYLGAFWLVPAWFEYPDQKERSPARIISLMTIQHQDAPNQKTFPRFVLNVPISRDVFDGRVPPERAGGYIVIDRPDIRLPLPSSLN